MEIIPAIDIIDGACVRLTQGNYHEKTIYASNPLEVAKQMEDHGVKSLHLVDLDGAKKGKIIHLKVLEIIAKNTLLKIDFGGGVKTVEDAKNIIEAGAHWVTIGSLAVKQPETMMKIINAISTEKIMLGADVKNEYLQIHGWLENTDITVYQFIEKYKNLGIQRFFCTDISKDGMLEGPAIDLYRKILKQFPEIYFIASGGVTSLNDLQNLKSIGCKAAIVGKAIYEGHIRLSEIQTWNQQNKSTC
ncbi:MAG: 1-(5-phosphoribosyl)-5-[(5-phosphoribosylamino)methylideneamino]imidazole-4-carboxamide isomerase [Flavobacteriales bacterium]|nr:1-(5-phosphoribosyl)-5-[(5-phosphoribosylamino)methylideneamino]imidazole-4-carboxamide isomerase [Flavobacteriales bacterium]